MINGGSGYASYPLSFVFTPTNGLGSGASATHITRATKNKIFKWNKRFTIRKISWYRISSNSSYKCK